MPKEPAIFELVNAVMEAGIFVDPPCYTLSDCEEEPTGLFLDEYEKAIFTVQQKLAAQYSLDYKNLDSEEFEEKMAKIREFDRLAIVENKLKALDMLLWVNIKERIFDAGIECDLDKLRIGNNFEIVEFFPEQENEEDSVEKDKNVLNFKLKYAPKVNGKLEGPLYFKIPRNPEEN
jgi:hypothetical protein